MDLPVLPADPRSRSWRPDLRVLRAVLLADAVAAQRVVVEAAVLHQAQPLPPAGRHVRPVVLVQVLPEEGCRQNQNQESDSRTAAGTFPNGNAQNCTCPVSRVVEVDAEGARLVVPLPRQRGAVLVVGVGVVVVHVPAGRKQVPFREEPRGGATICHLVKQMWTLENVPFV